MASLTLSVASVQISISSWRRSSSVTNPLRNCDWTLSARASYSARISALFSGVLTSSSPIVRPALVANRNPRSLIASRVVATSVRGVVLDQHLDQPADVGLRHHVS